MGVMEQIKLWTTGGELGLILHFAIVPIALLSSLDILLQLAYKTNKPQNGAQL